jgi:photosystem II stability/assembly factor-like uncharacterized protein
VRITCSAICAALLCLPVLSSGQAKPLDLQTEVLKQAKWRSIGPANMGGRIADIAVHEKNPSTFYVANATGGLIKTENNGTTWMPLFDSQPVASVGAVAVAPSDPNVIYVGTGEANGRNSSSWGNGVYRSADAGKTWKHIGLDDSQHIGRVIVDPADANTVWVAAAGHLWGSHPMRGVYKTTDGGKTWQHSLKKDNETGAIDVAMTPDGKTVFAALYRRRRTPYSFEAVSDSAGIYRTTDGGKTWQQCKTGLPAEQIGRIGLSVSKSQPRTVYAVIESQAGGATTFSEDSKYGGVFRSDDGGETWKQMSKKAPRGFYFGQIRVDPTNPERVYVLGFDLLISEDGGKTFKSTSNNVHSDLHALWINPARPESLVLGTDGGIYLSHDKGANWNLVNNFPMGEFYEVAVDNARPFRVYGGLQDNTNWFGPSATTFDTGPKNSDWTVLGGGDGFYVLPHPTDPNVVYSESQGGFVVRNDLRTGIYRLFQPRAAEGSPAFRFNWNSPLELSKWDTDKLYIGGNRLFTWTKKGTEWNVISPDLSKQDGVKITTAGTTAENYGTIVSLSESPVRRGVIWAGTDDGNIHLTTDEGKTWTDVSKSLPANIRHHYVKRVEASAHVESRAYAALDGHRSDDMMPYLFATEDSGRTWRSIVNNLPKTAPVKSIAESPMNPEVLFIGTEFGAWVTFDRGGEWHKLQNDLPTVAVDALAIQARDHALVAATHGRSFYVLDNILPLESLTPAVRKSAVHLFPIAPGHQFNVQGRTWFGGSGEFIAANPPFGVEIVYWLKELQDTPAKIVVKDKDSKTITEINGERVPGLHRVRWNMKPTGDAAKDDAGKRFVKTGEYTVTLTVGKETRTEKVTITGLPELSEEHSDEYQQGGSSGR